MSSPTPDETPGIAATVSKATAWLASIAPLTPSASPNSRQARTLVHSHLQALHSETSRILKMPPADDDNDDHQDDDDPPQHPQTSSATENRVQ